jgi:hypothetical protein
LRKVIEGTERRGSELVTTAKRDKTVRSFSAFLNDDAGAVTVDWVVLTAAVVGLGLIVFTFMRPGVSSLASEIRHALQHVQGCMESDGHSCP